MSDSFTDVQFTKKFIAEMQYILSEEQQMEYIMLIIWAVFLPFPPYIYFSFWFIYILLCLIFFHNLNFLLQLLF